MIVDATLLEQKNILLEHLEIYNAHHPADHRYQLMIDMINSGIVSDRDVVECCLFETIDDAYRNLLIVTRGI